MLTELMFDAIMMKDQTPWTGAIFRVTEEKRSLLPFFGFCFEHYEFWGNTVH